MLPRVEPDTEHLTYGIRYNWVPVSGSPDLGSVLRLPAIPSWTFHSSLTDAFIPWYQAIPTPSPRAGAAPGSHCSSNARCAFAVHSCAEI
jgi:hypothetical protein